MRSTITFLRKGLLATALVTPLLSAVPSNVSARIVKPGFTINETALINNGWSKIFEDDFNGGTLDGSKWTYWTSGAYNNELQCYQLANLGVRNGDLQITAREEQRQCATSPGVGTLTDFDYTSGRIESIQSFGGSGYSQIRIYGRIRLPSDYGLWPAFWTYNDPWPTKGEIDIMEAKVDVAQPVPPPAIYQTNYFYGLVAGTNLVSGAESINSASIFDPNYHVFMVDWSENQLKFYFDGVLKDIKSPASPGGEYIDDFWGQTQRIVLNLAYGGDFLGVNFVPGPITYGTMKVDWVKVFVKY